MSKSFSRTLLLNSSLRLTRNRSHARGLELCAAISTAVSHAALKAIPAFVKVRRGRLAAARVAVDPATEHAQPVSPKPALEGPADGISPRVVPIVKAVERYKTM